MKKAFVVLALVLILGEAVAYAQQYPGMMGGCCGGMGPGMMGGMSMVRHHYFMMHGMPFQYRYLSNPLNPSERNIKDGGKLYARNCASCHGPKGYGNGPAGRNLNPPPANISWVVRMPMATDSYLFWTISDGGKYLGTAMPSFKEIFSVGDIWKIILYLRAGLPSL